MFRHAKFLNKFISLANILRKLQDILHKNEEVKPQKERHRNQETEAQTKREVKRSPKSPKEDLKQKL